MYNKIGDDMKVKLHCKEGILEVDDEYSDDEIDTITKEKLDNTIEIDINKIKEENE